MAASKEALEFRTEFIKRRVCHRKCQGGGASLEALNTIECDANMNWPTYRISSIKNLPSSSVDSVCIKNLCWPSTLDEAVRRRILGGGSKSLSKDSAAMVPTYKANQLYSVTPVCMCMENERKFS